MNDLEKLFNEIRDIAKSQAVLENQVSRMNTDIQNLFKLIDNRFPTKDEFKKLEENVQQLADESRTFVNKEDFNEHKKENEKFITKEEFDPIKRFVYGLITFVLLAVLGVLMSLVTGTPTK